MPIDLHKKRWGLFLPLYAFRRADDWGCGAFTDLVRLARWIAPYGGTIVATLPLLATFLDEPFDPSPYRPVSRFAWNDVFLDIPAVPAFQECPAARQLVASTSFQNELRRLRAERDVNYRAVMALKRKVLTLLPGDHRTFAREQLIAARDAAHDVGVDFYFDLPLGVHPEGVDAQRERQLFDFDVSVGAPPDAIFSGGQDWGFPPLRPDRLHAEDYRYLRQSLRHQFEMAKLLRIDHVMWLHRLYWIRPGHTARTGEYVPYPARELYAVFLEEAQRARAQLVGENLGTVPPEVETALDRHGMLKLYVAQYETERAKRIPENVVASLNTHDMPPFAAAHPGASRALLRAELKRLAASDARVVMINLEDLWLETEPHNRPGTTDERNWRRRARFSFDEFSRDHEVTETLNMLTSIRGRSSL